MVSKVCVLGLDCAPPELVFDRFRADMPNLDRLMRTGVYGPLESTTPPITVPAWMSMMTGKDPGTLGIYGFRNRKDHSYDAMAFANSRMVREETVWDILAKHGRRSILLGVPLTYPPRPVNGLMVCDFLAPNTGVEYTFPPELSAEIRDVVGDYVIDVRNFRTNDKYRLLADIHDMTDKRFKLARHLLTTKAWDFFMVVEMGTDRIHHGFWRYFDRDHPLYIPGNPFEKAIHDYYVAVDRYVGEIVALLPANTLLLVVSDHGAKKMDGGICFNDWLIQEGYLVLKQPPAGPTRFSPDLVDWSGTRAWGDGGYYGRLFLNIEGREPHGIVPANAVESLRTELTSKLEALGDEHGQPIGTQVFRPECIYRTCNNVAPDLIVYFGDLNWRSVGTVGNPSLWTHENDTGPDDANHAQFGIAIASIVDAFGASGAPTGERREGMSIYDIAPTILEAFGLQPPAGLGRTSIQMTLPSSDSVYSPEEEAEIARRLEDLGYL